MSSVTPKSQSWSATRKNLTGWDKAELLDLIKDLYRIAPGNRDFVHARCASEDVIAEILESYRSKIITQFFPKRGDPKLKLGEARKAIREFEKATGDAPGTAELLMTYVENGLEFTNEYGDIDERFYSSLESALAELAKRIHDNSKDLYPLFRDRLADLEADSDGIGWGFHDFICDVVGQLKSELGSNREESVS